MLTVPLMTALYCFRWYPQLNTEILELSEGTVVSSHAFMSMHTDILIDCSQACVFRQ